MPENGGKQCGGSDVKCEEPGVEQEGREESEGMNIDETPEGETNRMPKVGPKIQTDFGGAEMVDI